MFSPKKIRTYSLIIAIVSLLFLVSWQSKNSSPDTTSKDHAAITKIINNQLDAWNSGSIDGFMKGYWNNDSLLFMTANGPKLGWETVRKMYHKSFPNREKMGQLSFNLERFHRIEDGQYMVIGKWLVDEKTGEKSGYFTLVFKNINKAWLIVVDHTFSD
jgi:ketosteroid isomerase-like protein